MSDQPLYTTDHPRWCSPSRCLVATVEQGATLVVLEHLAEPLALVTSEAKFTLERAQEVDRRQAGPALPEFIRFAFTLHDVDEPAVVHLSAADAKDLAEVLRSVADQMDGQR